MPRQINIPDKVYYNGCMEFSVRAATPDDKDAIIDLFLAVAAFYAAAVNQLQVCNNPANVGYRT